MIGPIAALSGLMAAIILAYSILGIYYNRSNGGRLVEVRKSYRTKPISRRRLIQLTLKK